MRKSKTRERKSREKFGGEGHGPPPGAFPKKESRRRKRGEGPELKKNSEKRRGRGNHPIKSQKTESPKGGSPPRRTKNETSSSRKKGSPPVSKQKGEDLTRTPLEKKGDGPPREG